MTLRSPDEWASEHGTRTGVEPWWAKVPPEVRVLAQSATTSVVNLVKWFRTEVADAYPDAAWPAEATASKVNKLLKDAPRADA